MKIRSRHIILPLLIAGMTSASLLAKKNDVARNLAVFNQLYKELTTFYVDSIDPNKSITTAITAMLDEIDPYTEYIPEEELENFERLTTGEYSGIGSLIMQRDDAVYISGPRAGSPSAEAGLMPGDRIVAIDGDTVLNLSSDRVSKLLRGQSGTTVTVQVDRPYVGADSAMTFQIKRRKITEPSVEYSGVLGDTIGYISLTTFNENSPEEVKNALAEILQAPRLHGLVFDLRSNGGGILESAVKILSYFLPNGTEVLRTRGKGTLDEKIYKTSGKPLAPNLPMVVLIDGGTASSAEIMSGALQDLDRAVIVGNRSFGKGLVQTTRSLPYNNLLKVTVSKYYIPSGRLIQAIDYSRRNPDGSVARIPDSLTNVFHTANGRVVRDGGGITPDVKVEQPDINRIVYNIVRDNWAFDFATRYAATHSTIPPAGEFTITDEIYDEFKQFIDPDRFQYDKMCEIVLERLRQTAEVEGYMSDDTKTEFDKLEKMLKHDLNHDLDQHRTQIEPYISGEIVERYYYQRGRALDQLRTDLDMERATAILSNPGEYKAILAP